MNAPVNDMEVFMGASCFGKNLGASKRFKGGDKDLWFLPIASKIPSKEFTLFSLPHGIMKSLIVMR